MFPVSIFIVGAGDRGMNAYAPYALKYPDKARVVGVAEPLDVKRIRADEKFNIPPDCLYKSWQEVLKEDKIADAVLICTQDKMHVEPAIAFMKAGYNVLLEKPMAVSEKDCRRIAAAAKKYDVITSVCFVLRYTSYTKKMNELLESKCIGDVISIRHFEPVGWWHQAHSFVRGNWGNSFESSFMLMTKSCHDMDYIRFLAGAPCSRVSSFGSLKYFRIENKPENAGDKCTNCPKFIEEDCPYSALKIYSNVNPNDWPASVVTTNHTLDGVNKALKTNRYGKCVFACDNDVVDHQVVAMEFENGVTASFTMSAFTPLKSRETQILGSRGMLTGDSRFIKHFSFITSNETVFDTDEIAENANAGIGTHGGGDEGCIANFIDAVARNDKSAILTGPEEALESHLIAFASERSRLSGKVVSL